MSEDQNVVVNVITNAVGFALAEHDQSESIKGWGRDRWVKVSKEELVRAEAVAKTVYDHLTLMGYLDV